MDIPVKFEQLDSRERKTGCAPTDGKFFNQLTSKTAHLRPPKDLINGMLVENLCKLQFLCF
jgi:hypothetical protein